MEKNSQKSLIKFFVLTMIFVLPVIASVFLYHYRDHFQFKTLNHGTLVNPPLSATEWLSTDKEQKKWLIVYKPTECCGAECEKVMYDLHQVREALGKDHTRIDLVLVTNQSCQVKDAHDFRHLSFKNQQDEKVSGRIYLVDPIGNLFMYYPDSTDGMNILKDLKRVLEVSQIG